MERYRNGNWERKNARMMDSGQTGVAPKAPGRCGAPGRRDRPAIQPGSSRDRTGNAPGTMLFRSGCVDGPGLRQVFRLCHSRIRRFFAVCSPPDPAFAPPAADRSGPQGWRRRALPRSAAIRHVQRKPERKTHASARPTSPPLMAPCTDTYKLGRPADGCRLAGGLGPQAPARARAVPGAHPG